MKKNLLVLLALFAAVFAAVPARAADYPIGDNNDTQSATLPFYTSSGTFTSITQQIYLASELTAAGASAGEITDMKFWFGNKTSTVREVTRNLEIYLSLVSSEFTEFELESSRLKFVAPGTKVYDNNYTIPATESNGDRIERTIPISSFAWDGTSNIVLTVVDKTDKKFYSLAGDDYSHSNLKSYLVATSTARFVHQYWMAESASEFASYKSNLAGKLGYRLKMSGDADELTAHKYVNRIIFSIAPLPAPSVPTGLAVSDITTSSAVVSWNTASGATSYDLQQSTDGENWSSLDTDVSGTSYTWSGLAPASTYFVRVRATNAVGISDWSAPVSVATEAVHEHNGVSFEKWSSANALPTEGSFFLNNDVTFGWDPDVTLTGDLNLCLNGKTANLGMSGIIVPSGKTLTIFDDSEGGTGKITSFFPGQEGISFAGVITVQSGGTLILGEGSIENTFPDDDPDAKSIAIASAGTFKLSGAPAISGNNMDIFLAGVNVITIESGKPLTNASPWTISSNLSGTITSGWANMGGANPADFFSSVSASAPAVVLADGEAKLVSALALADSENNDSKISDGENQNTAIVVALTRSFVSSQFNTICLPFNLSDAQLQAVFGAGYDLEEFASSSFDGETIDLAFTQVNALVAGKPYLIQPAADVANPVFDNVTIPLGLEHPADQTDDDFISFHGVFSPTELQANNKNLLFLGANNELFWPSVTNNIPGFRAYFEVKGSAKKAVRARIVQKDNAATAIDNVQRDDVQCTKVLRNGQLHLLRNGEVYNVQGQRIK